MDPFNLRSKPKIISGSSTFINHCRHRDKSSFIARKFCLFHSFLRAQKSYTPPPDLNAKLSTIFNQLFATDDAQTAIQTAAQKFELLHRCSEELQHSVPNSLLHCMKSLGDVRQFYEMPVSTITPLDKLKNMELPKNLHVQYDYIRFHPGKEGNMVNVMRSYLQLFVQFLETDTKFNGVTAFPKRPTVVTGIHYKDKYKGHKCEERWPFSLK